MRYILQSSPLPQTGTPVRRIPSSCMVNYKPLLAFLHSILTAQRAKRSPDLPCFRYKRIKFLSLLRLPPPMEPLWTSRPLVSLRYQYPDDRFHVLMELKTIYDSGQGIVTVDPNLTYAHAPNGSSYIKSHVTMVEKNSLSSRGTNLMWNASRSIYKGRRIVNLWKLTN
jgi:hypothetical protein